MKTIEIRKRLNDFHAQISGRPELWGCGTNSAEAVGDLVISHASEFQIAIAHTIEKPMWRKKLELTINESAWADQTGHLPLEQYTLIDEYGFVFRTDKECDLFHRVVHGNHDTWPWSDVALKLWPLENLYRLLTNQANSTHETVPIPQLVTQKLSLFLSDSYSLSSNDIVEDQNYVAIRNAENHLILIEKSKLLSAIDIVGNELCGE